MHGIIALLIILIGVSIWLWYVFKHYHARSATLTFKGIKTMPATILVGGTANSLFQEWTGPSGTGTVVPNAGTIAYSSSNTAVATVDPASGVATGVSAGTASITGVDSVNSLTASDTLTVNNPAAQSATLTLTAN
jgi:Bacterial Ig-like domain (group 2)